MYFLDQIQNYWAIIAFIGTVIASWVRYESKLDGLKREIKDQKNDFEVAISSLRDRIRAVEIKAAGVDSVAGDIKGINAKLDIILKKVNL